MTGPEEPRMPQRGEIARDTRTNCVGKVTGNIGGRVCLRPIRGGLEWEVPPNKIEILALSEGLNGAIAAKGYRECSL
ncbi:hypothetical protein [Streptomyces sp. 4F14]|uniref:hypothetical protein n=1 Tax=Streptomyces sp. 4F14 TaxID=3394380 RepID=UPI003A8ABA32